MIRYTLICTWILTSVWCKGQGVALDNPLLEHASISICMVEVKSGEEVYSYDPDRSLIPASSAV